MLRAPFKQGGRKKRNGKTLCYGGHRARGGGSRRQATPRARPLDASAVNLEPRREFLRSQDGFPVGRHGTKRVMLPAGGAA